MHTTPCVVFINIKEWQQYHSDTLSKGPWLDVIETVARCTHRSFWSNWRQHHPLWQRHPHIHTTHVMFLFISRINKNTIPIWFWRFHGLMLLPQWQDAPPGHFDQLDANTSYCGRHTHIYMHITPCYVFININREQEYHSNMLSKVPWLDAIATMATCTYR